MNRLLISSLAGLFLVVAGWIYWTSTAEIRNAERIIAGIENYRQTQGRLPDTEDHATMQSLGFELRAGWHPDFQTEEKGSYQITILEGFDGPYWIYNSASQSWRKGYPN